MYNLLFKSKDFFPCGYVDKHITFKVVSVLPNHANFLVEVLAGTLRY
jgi:hypothetical protein